MALSVRRSIPPPVSAAQSAMPPAIKFVLATMFLNAVGFGIIVPVVPDLVMELSQSTIAEATAIGGWMSFTYAAFQFFFSPIIGNLSDRVGRRPVLLFALAGFAIDFIILAVAGNLLWLFIARALTGIAGATNGPSQSAIADIVPAGERSRYFGYIGAAFGAGFVLGPALGGLLGEVDHRLPFYAAAALAFTNFLYGWFSFPETLKPENRRSFDWKRANPVGALLSIRHLPGLLPISAVYFLWQIATLVYPMIWAYYAIGRYGWSNGLVGLSLAVMGVAMAIMQTMVSPRIIRRLGERRTAFWGGLATVGSMVLIALIDNGWIALALMPLVALQSLVHPNLTAMMSRRADATTQGEVQGFASSVMAVGSIIAPLLFNPLQALFSGDNAPFHLPGAAFFVAAAIAAVAMLILWAMPRAATPDPVLGRR